MKLTAQVQQQPNTPTIPNNALGDATLISVIIAATIAALKQAWDFYKSKDALESELTQVLINDLRGNQKELVHGNREGFSELIAATKESSQKFQEVGKEIHNDIQQTLKSQTGIYASTVEQLSEIKRSLEALHRRLDVIEKDLQAILDK